MNARLDLDPQHHVGEVDRRIFGGFAEHLGRCIYEGIYDPGNPLSDANGFRRDVIEAVRGLAMPVMRYPGGNFVSNYNWTDGIGPREGRPARPDYAWHTVDPNTFGVDEFVAWAREVGTDPMMAVNLGTLGAPEAAALVEYCNLPAGTYWADRRVANGSAEPHGIRMWCLGNEMDGPWQAGHVPAAEYARRADQAGKLMRGLDGSIELVAAGSSGRFMSTYMSWDREVLEYCWDDLSFMSAHRYSENHRGDTGWFLAEGLEIDRIIADYAGLFDYVRALKRSKKRVYLSFDEWNVWYKGDAMDGKWARAPHLLEEVYNLEDALVCAQYLNAFIRRADVVKVACLAQVVNVIAPILTSPQGVLLQASYFPIQAISNMAGGLSLRPVLSCPTYTAGERGEVPTLDVSATLDSEGNLALFVVNRSQSEPATVAVSLAGRAITAATGTSLHGSDPKAANTWEAPNKVQPTPADVTVNAAGGAALAVPPLGFAAIRCRTVAG